MKGQLSTFHFLEGNRIEVPIRPWTLARHTSLRRSRVAHWSQDKGSVLVDNGISRSQKEKNMYKASVAIQSRNYSSQEHI